MVCEGRDQGTTVFPDAYCKFFLTAKPETRANRRFIELQEKGVRANPKEILDAIIARDLRDETRKISPLVPAKDAMIIDTSDLEMHKVIDIMHQEIKRRGQK
jgi:cytidylate kinase